MKKLLFIFLFLISFSGISQTLIDSYSESNKDYACQMYSGNYVANGQSFTNTNACTLGSAKFYMTRNGTITGNIYATIYAHTGTYGTSSKPTGSVLATSDAVAISTIPTGSIWGLITFTFSGANQISLTSNTYYVLVVAFSGGDVNNEIFVGADNSSPTHSGNRCALYGATWYTYTLDCCFYVYTTAGAPAANPPKLMISY